MTTFFKLDTGVIRNFDAVLGDSLQVFSTGPLNIVRVLARRKGWVSAITTWARGTLFPDEAGRQLAQGNVARKQIRLPALFGNPIVSAIYGHLKAGQATVLRVALSEEIAARDPNVVIIFNGSVYPESVLADVSSERARVFVEGGFFPGTLQIDPNGLNGVNSVPRDPEFYLDAKDDYATGGLPSTVNDRASKVAGSGAVSLDPGYVFVPFQVPSDMQVTLHSPWVRDMETFLDVVRAAADRNSDDVFVIKEHPSFKRSVRGLRPDHPRVIFANDNVTSDLIQNARAVMTLNSTVGIEALLFDKPVITLGHACYNVDGLVFHAEDPETLDAALQKSRGWSHNPKLRSQFLGYLWNRYLMRGTYQNLPEDLAEQIKVRLVQPMRS